MRVCAFFLQILRKVGDCHFFITLAFSIFERDEQVKLKYLKEI
jgi:hypothetical protein